MKVNDGSSYYVQNVISNISICLFSFDRSHFEAEKTSGIKEVQGANWWNIRWIG